MRFLASPTRVLFFTGKGGVGKTTLACATAVQLADSGLRVLLVSTDPASNLDEVLAAHLVNHPTPVPSVPNLWALNVDPETAAREYRERMVGPYRRILPDVAIRSMEEQFSGSCTLEIAAFDEFSRLLGDSETTREFDHVVFDTAPTGHTLRLLTLPSAWSTFMEENSTGTSCLGPLAGLQSQQQLYQQTAQALKDSQLTTLMLVTRPEPSALRETARTGEELRQLGVCNQQLIVNGVFAGHDSEDPIARALVRRGQQALASIPKSLRNLSRATVPLAGSSLLGVEALRSLGSRSTFVLNPHELDCPKTVVPDSLGSLVDDLAKLGRGVILAMGKGGVGKTTVAAAVAVALAQRGLDVHLSTTDPADHLAQVLASDSLPTLSVGRIDPALETANYTAEVMDTAGANLDDQGRSLLAEDLRSPCTEEIAVFRAFARTIATGTDRFVVLDTAPTGHTILLLDAAMAYHREVTRQSSKMPPYVEQLLPRLRDPDFTRVLIVALPEATPVHEAARLQEDLRRANIEPFAWVVNQSFLPLQVRDPVLKQRRAEETRFVREVMDSLASRTAIVPWLLEAPAGTRALERVLGQDGTRASTYS